MRPAKIETAPSVTDPTSPRTLRAPVEAKPSRLASAASTTVIAEPVSIKILRRSPCTVPPTITASGSGRRVDQSVLGFRATVALVAFFATANVAPVANAIDPILANNARRVSSEQCIYGTHGRC